ncbi:phospholipase A2, membrane associated-like isoform 2-T2 [Sarcophilus harrisii]
MRDFKMKIVLLLVVLSICGQKESTQWVPPFRCCSAHDCCYLKLKKKGCKPKRLKYHYVIQAQSVLCGNGNKCQKKVCACDKAAAYCMKKNVKNYQAI